MGKSFRSRDTYEDMDYMEDFSEYKRSRGKKDDKKFEIQKARKKAQAERDRAMSELSDGASDRRH